MGKPSRRRARTTLSVGLAILIGWSTALATPCWYAETFTITVTAPSSGCNSSCPAGQVCVQWDLTCNSTSTSRKACS